MFLKGNSNPTKLKLVDKNGGPVVPPPKRVKTEKGAPGTKKPRRQQFSQLMALRALLTGLPFSEIGKSRSEASKIGIDPIAGLVDLLIEVNTDMIAGVFAEYVLDGISIDPATTHFCIQPELASHMTAVMTGTDYHQVSS